MKSTDLFYARTLGKRHRRQCCRRRDMRRSSWCFRYERRNRCLCRLRNSGKQWRLLYSWTSHIQASQRGHHVVCGGRWVGAHHIVNAHLIPLHFYRTLNLCCCRGRSGCATRFRLISRRYIRERPESSGLSTLVFVLATNDPGALVLGRVGLTVQPADQSRFSFRERGHLLANHLKKLVLVISLSESQVLACTLLKLGV